MKFLIIDDNPDSVTLLTRYLKKNLKNVTDVISALNGEDGLELARKEFPDIILLDLIMPGMDGFKVLNLLKSDTRTRNIPVVIVTSQLKDKSTKLKAISVGADSFINFPVAEDELIKQIKKVIKQNDKFLLINKYKKKLGSIVSDKGDYVELDGEAENIFEDLKTNYSELIHLSENLMREVEKNQLLLKALKLSEEKFKILFDQSKDFIFLLKKEKEDLIIKDVNKTALIELDLKKDEILNKSLLKLYSEDSKSICNYIQNLTAGKISYVELTHKTKLGKLIEVEVTATNIVVGEEKLIYLAERDITQRNKMLQTVKKLSRVVEESPVSIIITDTDGKIEYVNKYFTELTGYEFDEVKGKNPNILKSGYHSKEFYAELWSVITGGDIWYGEFRNKKKNGEVYWESSIITPITDKDGVIINYVGLNQDITVQKQLADQLRKAKEEAERANKLKSEFLAIISHEIRTPVNVLINYSNLLIEELIDNPDELVLLSREGIQNAGKRLIRTIDLLLNFSMLETGNFELDKKENDIQEILEEIVKEFHSIAEEKKVELRIEILTKDKKVFCDRYSIIQILSNLLDNALKFTDEGVVKLKLYVNAHGKKVLCIEDSGIGINDTDLNKIFNPFWQADTGYSRQFEGLGLGLAVVKRYCDLNGFKIKVDSKKGKGSKFLIIFD